ncbi:GtrA family protein [Sporolactobacillus sp. THM7-7]|nr:GtrA family protein [Sporolactobacillus sp. THM7-7]
MDDETRSSLLKENRSNGKTRVSWIRQAVLFSLIGVLNTAVDLFVFICLTHFFSLSYAAAQLLSYGAGMLNSYLWNRSVTFSSSAQTSSRFIKFAVLNVSVLIMTLAVMHSLLFLPLYLNKLISTAVGLIFNFVFSKFWVFRA